MRDVAGARLGIVFAVVLLAGGLASRPDVHAQSTVPGTCTAAAPAMRGASTEFVTASNLFGFHLLHDLLTHKKSANIFISPTSAEIALAMMYDGARRGTAEAMAATLGLKGMNQESVRGEAGALLTSLISADPKVRLDLADALWTRSGAPFRPVFLEHARQFYSAKVTALDFNSPSAVLTMNSWVSCATHGKIASIVKRIPQDVVLYLMNAVYFHRLWTKTFDPKSTKESTFTRDNGRKIRVPLMWQSALLPYYEEPDFQVTSLPYGSGRFSMVIVLPRRDLSLAAFEPSIASRWRTWMDRLQQRYIDLGFPRFTLQENYLLNQSLENLGMGIAFSRLADFSGISPLSLLISKVRQKTYLSVDEKGTTAAAVTSASSKLFCCSPPLMLVDHSFFLAIRDNTTGSILFVGAIDQPSS